MTIICEWCNRIIDVPDPEPPEKYDPYEILGRRTPHYICAECIRKAIKFDRLIGDC
jgi:hypothetical protein